MEKEDGKTGKPGTVILTIEEMQQILDNNPKAEVKTTKSKDGSKEYHEVLINGNKTKIRIHADSAFITQFEKSDSRPTLSVNITKTLSEDYIKTLLEINNLKFNIVSQYLKSDEKYKKHIIYPMIKTSDRILIQDAKGGFTYEPVAVSELYLNSGVTLKVGHNDPFCTKFYDFTMDAEITKLKNEEKPIPESLLEELKTAINSPLI